MRMKRMVWMCFLGATAAWPQANVPGVLSPEVLSDHRVVFRLKAPQAVEVTVSGDFWVQQGRVGKLVKGEDGVWSLTTDPLPPDLYSYSFRLDGVRLPDPANGMTKPGIAETQSAFIVPGPATTLLETGSVPHGEIRTVFYPSTVAGTTRRMHVYLPPGYEGGKTKYPVVYLLHGGGDDDGTWESIGRVNFMLDHLIAEGKAKPMILVMPALWVLDPPLSADRREQNEGLFAQLLRKDILPYVDAHYRVLPGPENRALGGLGDGRNFLPTLVWKSLDEFNSILFVSGGSDKEHFALLEQAYPGVIGKQANIDRVHFYIGDGVNDGSFAVAKSFVGDLKTRGYKVEFWQSDNTHGWPEFRYNFLQFAMVAFR